MSLIMIDKMLPILFVVMFLVCGCDKSMNPITLNEKEVIHNKIFITTEVGSMNEYSFAILNTDGSNLEFFGEGFFNVSGISFSPDKSFFCFQSFKNWPSSLEENEDGSLGFQIYKCTLEDKQIDTLAISGIDMKLSNNGNQIAFLTLINNTPDTCKLCISNIDGSGFNCFDYYLRDINSRVYGWGENDNSVICADYNNICIGYDPPWTYYEIPVDGKSQPEEINNPNLEEIVYLNDFDRVDSSVALDSIKISYTEGNYPDYHYQARRFLPVDPFPRYYEYSLFSYDLKTKKEYLIADSLKWSSQLPYQLVESPDQRQILFTSYRGWEISDYNGENRRVILSSEIISGFHEFSNIYIITWL